MARKKGTSTRVSCGRPCGVVSSTRIRSPQQCDIFHRVRPMLSCQCFMIWSAPCFKDGLHPVGATGRWISGPRPRLDVRAPHETAVAQSDSFGRAELSAQAESRTSVRIPDLPQDAEVAHRQVHQVMSDLYTVGVEHEALNPVGAPSLAERPQVAVAGLPREAGIGLSPGQYDNLQHARGEQRSPSAPSFRSRQTEQKAHSLHKGDSVPRRPKLHQLAQRTDRLPEPRAHHGKQAETQISEPASAARRRRWRCRAADAPAARRR